MSIFKIIYKALFSEKIRINNRKRFKKLKGLFLKGNNAYCNCCGRSFSKFLDKSNGIDSRHNAECPNCGSLERTRVLLEFLKNETDLFSKSNSLLHIAPEDTLKEIFKKSENLYYVNGDINRDFADEVIDITSIHYPDNTFDYIICSHVLGHVPNEKQAIEELYRTLKIGGKAFILTPIHPENNTFENKEIVTDYDRLINYGEKDLIRLHGQDFEERLKRENTVVKMIDYRLQIEAAYAKKLSVGDGYRELIFLCQKT
ncbi:class I SAM-dependent methyltransferase [Empedobacter brevis]|uniref:class I SAM-dependent methyltransferase n=1 Tax=Empedobacter brevis TaxID=247 RepID=UPI0033424C6C